MATDTTAGFGNEATYNQLPDYYNQTAQQFSGTIQDYLDKMNAPGGFTSGYSGAQVAGIDPYQTQAYQNVGGLSSQYNPYTQSGGNRMVQGQGWLEQGQAYTQQTPRGTFDQAGNFISDQYSQLGNVDPYLNQAGGLIQGSANYNQNTMQQHLNPYLSGVNDEIARLGNQNLMEKVLPDVNSTFSGAGQFGSTRNADFTNRAIRDNQQTISGAQATAMNQAYGQAGQDYLGWARQGLTAGQGMGALGNLALDKAKTGTDIGTSLGNLGGQQASYGNILGNMGEAMSGLGDQYGQYGQRANNQDWTNANNYWGMGGQMQGYNQNILNVAKQDWLDRWQQPAALMGGLSQMIPNYSAKVTPDTTGYRAPPGAQNNNYADLISAWNLYNGN